MRDDKPTPIGPLSAEAMDRILAGVFGSRVQRCVGCSGTGTVTEWMRCEDGTRLPWFGATCCVCGGKGMVSVVAA